MSITSKVLIGRYDVICNKIVEEFCEKQGLEFDGWVGDNVGEVASFNTIYFFNMTDIILDLRENADKGEILKWQDENLESENYINYYSFTKGLRCNQLK